MKSEKVPLEVTVLHLKKTYYTIINMNLKATLAVLS